MSDAAMHVLHVVGSTGIGGAERHVLDLCRIQVAQGMVVRVAMPVVGELSTALDRLGIKYELFGLSWRWNPFTLGRLRHIIHRDPPQLIHAHMPRSAVMVGRTKGRTPCVVTAHNIVKSIRPFVGADFVICVSKQVNDSLLALGWPSERASIVHNAIVPLPPDIGSRDQVRAAMGWCDAVVILCVARLVPAKGQSYAIRALPEILSKEPAAQLVLVGSGSDDRMLYELASRLGVAQHVEFLGARHDVPQLLLAADIYLQPSIKEGFCIAFLEAMSVGLPCVGTRTGAIPDMLARGDTGILIEPEDVSGIVEGIGRLIANPESAIEYAENAKAFVIQAFSQDRQLLETLAVYRRVIASAEQ